jgi:hypothetical protein
MSKKFNSVEEKRAYERSLYAASKGAYKEKVVARKKKNQQKLRQFIWDYLKEHPCVDCGEPDPVVLEFDHMGDKKMAIGDISYHNPSLEKLKEEIEKCEVRCANCHRRKTAIQLEWYQGVTRS